MILNNFEINANFWRLNPQLIIPEEFNKLYEADKSKGKESSSKLMWAVFLYCDSESKFFNLSLQDRKDIIAKDYLKNPKFKWKTLEPAIKMCEKLILTPAQRQLIDWARLMNEKNEYMKTLKYNGNTADEIEKRLLSNGKLFDELTRLTDLLHKEGSGGNIKGGSVESLSESGEI